MELSHIEVQHLKEQNHRRIKRVVAGVALAMIIVSLVLVALSLSLGPKIDQLDPSNSTLVSESGRLDGEELFEASHLRLNNKERAENMPKTAND